MNIFLTIGLLIIQSCSFNRGRTISIWDNQVFIPSQEEISHNQKNIFPNSEIEYKLLNGQLFIKVYISSGNSPKLNSKNSLGNKSEGKEYWAVLDSGSSDNLLVDITDRSIGNISISPRGESIPMEFQPWSIQSSPDYKMILGQPFFKNYCIVLDYGIPKYIEPNNKQLCSRKLRERFSHSISLKSSLGQYIIPVRVENQYFDIALDTGSGISTIPHKILNLYGTRTDISKKILYAVGRTKELPLYQLHHPIILLHSHGETQLKPKFVFSEKEVWQNMESYYPTLGMDFFRNFRIYIDIRSKIIGLEPNGIER